jgi:hypothetical protein
MHFEYAVDLPAHCFFLQRFTGDPKADGHNFQCDDADLTIVLVILVV